MNEQEKHAAEGALVELLAAIQPICEQFGITTKRAMELLASSHIEAMNKKGLSQVDIVALSGYSVKTVQKLRNGGVKEDQTSQSRQIALGWASDHELPDRLSMQQEKNPSIVDLAYRYSKDLTPHAVVRCLVSAKLAKEEGEFLVRQTPPVVPSDNIDRLPVIGWSLKNIARTVGNNLSAANQSDRLPEFSTFTPCLKPGTQKQARAALRLLTEEFQKRAREVIRQFEAHDKMPGDEIGLGIYVFHNARVK